MNKRFLAAAFVALLAVFSLRLCNLDCDLPSFGISLYTSLDEGTYAAMALNKYNYGVVNCESLPTPSATPHAHRNNLIGNVATYCSLGLFGDNYFGLRFPSAVWALGTILLMATILLRRLPQSRFRNLIVVAALAVPVLDFQFLMASRIVEPSVVRMFFVTLLSAILVVPRRSRLSLFMAGFVAAVSVMLVYVTMVFVGLPLAVLLAWLLKRKNYGEAASLVLGSLVAFALGELYYRIVWHTSFFVNEIEAVAAFSKITAYAISSDAQSVLGNARSFLVNRCFVYNPPLLVLFAISLPCVVLKLLRRQISEAHVFFSFVAALFSQTLVCNDYIARKFIVVYPLVVLGVAFSLTEAIAFWRRLADWRVYGAFGGETDVARGRGRYALAFALVAAMILAFAVVYMPVFYIKPDKLDVKIAKDRIVFALSLLLPLVAAAFACLRPVRRNIVFAAVLVAGGWLAAGAWLSVKYVYGNSRHVERDFMLRLGDQLGSGRLYGEWSYAYTLYNDIKPVEGRYDDLVAGIRADGGGWLIHYEPTYIDKRLVKAVTQHGLALKPYVRLRHSLHTNGKFRDHVIYRVSPWSIENFALDP